MAVIVAWPDRHDQIDRRRVDRGNLNGCTCHIMVKSVGEHTEDRLIATRIWHWIWEPKEKRGKEMRRRSDAKE